MRTVALATSFRPKLFTLETSASSDSPSSTPLRIVGMKRILAANPVAWFLRGSNTFESTSSQMQRDINCHCRCTNTHVATTMKIRNHVVTSRANENLGADDGSGDPPKTR